jgi:hypothetical protein
MARTALAVLMVMLFSAAAEAKNYRKYNGPQWGSRWKQIFKMKEVNFQPYIVR